MRLKLEPVNLFNGADNEGRMVLIDGKLAAVLSRLSSDHENAGHWFLECGFGPIARCEVEFEDLNQAKSWIAKQLGD